MPVISQLAACPPVLPRHARSHIAEMSAILKLLPFAREPSMLDKAWMAVRYPLDLVASPVKAVVSIPALSFLVIPAFSSYGTSINLLFFYMTWAILIRSNDPIQVELFGTLGIRILFYVLPSLGFLAFDSASPNLAVSIKEHGETALPMGDEQGGRKGRWWRVALVSIGNVLLSVAIQIGLELLCTQVLHVRSLLKISTSVPFPWSIAKDLALGLLLREILTYGIHRYALHSEDSPITELHETWQHSLRAPFSLVAHYDHPVPYLLHVFLPMYLPAILFRFHFLTYQIYLIITSLEETFAYSGYNALPSAFILGGIARRQEKHLMGDGDGNFGCFGLADALMGTSLGIDIVDDVVDEAEEKQVGKKAKGKARAVGKKAQKRPTKKIRDREESESEDEDEALEEEEDDDVQEPLKKKKGRPKKNGTKSKGDDEEGDATGGEVDESPKTRSSRSRKKRSSEEEEGGRPNPKGKPPTRKASQKGKGSSRPRRRSDDD